MRLPQSVVGNSLYKHFGTPDKTLRQGASITRKALGQYV